LNADALILPVGAFIKAMINLKKFGLDVAIQEKYGNIFLDNMSDYSYFTESEEFGAGKGLDLISE
jgi:imidazoleglycerol phosphate synthase glutamine amidotransferase subunit HisH